MSPGLEGLWRCFQGVVPSLMATADAEGVPNVAYVSQVHLVDAGHVALSRQFFNKTTRNLAQNPRARVLLYDPLTFEAWQLRLRHERCESEGPLFDTMKVRIDAIAAHTGMAGIFKLIGADVFAVEGLARVEGFLSGPPRELPHVSPQGLRTELRGLQCVSERINRAPDLESLLEAVLQSLEDFFGFRHTMVLMAEEACGRLVTLASRGYDSSGVGAEVPSGEGLLGSVARGRRPLRVSGLHQELSYGRAMRRGVEAARGAVAPEVPLPGLPDARSALVLPLAVRDRLLGVLAAESRDPLAFDEWDQAYLEVVSNQIALSLDRMLERADEREEAGAEPAPTAPLPAPAGRRRTVAFYRGDDSIFVDGDYLVRNVPARILWKMLGEWSRDGRCDFSNRELRLDPALGLPELRDNLESRLILLRRRLEEKCPDLRLVSTGRGRLRLEVGAALELVEKDAG